MAAYDLQSLHVGAGGLTFSESVRGGPVRMADRAWTDPLGSAPYWRGRVPALDGEQIPACMETWRASTLRAPTSVRVEPAVDNWVRRTYVGDPQVQAGFPVPLPGQFVVTTQGRQALYPGRVPLRPDIESGVHHMQMHPHDSRELARFARREARQFEDQGDTNMTWKMAEFTRLRADRGWERGPGLSQGIWGEDVNDVQRSIAVDPRAGIPDHWPQFKSFNLPPTDEKLIYRPFTDAVY